MMLSIVNRFSIDISDKRWYFNSMVLFVRLRRGPKVPYLAVTHWLFIGHRVPFIGASRLS